MTSLVKRLVRTAVMHCLFKTCVFCLLLQFLKFYGLVWTFVSNKISLHSWQSLAIAYLFSIPVTFKSSSHAFSIFYVVFPFFLVPFFCICYTLFYHLWLCILSASPYHPSRRDLINVTISSLYNVSFICLSFYSPSFFCCGSVSFPYSLPFKYSEHGRLFVVSMSRTGSFMLF